MSEDRAVVLADGTTVGVYEYGDPDGRPVFAFHGVPACGAGFDWADAPARERGLRLLAPDRPGIGRSSGPPLEVVGDYPTRLDALATGLGIQGFAVLGYSGGGPYALACAAELGDRVTATAVCAGMGQVGVWAEVDEFEKTDRQMLTLCTERPRIARVVLSVSARLAHVSPASAQKSFVRQLSPSDAAVIEAQGQTPKETMALFVRAFRHGAKGVVDDYRTIARPWRVELRHTGPLTIFQGDADTMVPLRHAEKLAARLPDAKLVVWPGEGHLGTITHIGEVLDTLT